MKGIVAEEICTSLELLFYRQPYTYCCWSLDNGRGKEVRLSFEVSYPYPYQCR